MSVPIPKKQPLPDYSFDPLKPPHAAYTKARDTEGRATTSLVQRPRDSHPTALLLAAWVLGYLNIEIPTELGQIYLSQEIVDCATDAKLIDLSRSYMDTFFRCC